MKLKVFCLIFENVDKKILYWKVVYEWDEGEYKQLPNFTQVVSLNLSLSFLINKLLISYAIKKSLDNRPPRPPATLGQSRIKLITSKFKVKADPVHHHCYFGSRLLCFKHFRDVYGSCIFLVHVHFDWVIWS